MKIAAAICEYNPMHNGHINHIEKMKQLNPDFIIIIMSGNFSQRGELTVLNKYTRARQAILAGADAVIELPTIFATQTAEIFAKGGIKLINSLPGEKTIVFGTEEISDDFENLVDILINEDDALSSEIKLALDNGYSYIKAREMAISKLYGEKYSSMLSKPNNILAIEYIKAIKQNKYNIEIKQILREGDSYSSTKITSTNPSASAIRALINCGDTISFKNTMPDYVYSSLPNKLLSIDSELLFSLLNTTANNLSKTNDCSEGLENKILKELKTNNSIEELINNICNKRYTYSRIRRIILSDMLHIYKEDIFNALNSELYLKVLAVKKESDILNVLSKSAFPVITRKKDIPLMNEISQLCYSIDDKANTLYNYKAKQSSDQFKMLIV